MIGININMPQDIDLQEIICTKQENLTLCIYMDVYKFQSSCC